MMLCQVIATAGYYNVKRMTTFGPDLARGDASAVEVVVGIVHLIDAEDGFQAALVERLVMCHKRKPRYLRLNLLPYFGEDRRTVCIRSAKTMHLTAPVVVILWLWLDERVETIHHLTSSNNNHANSAYRRTLIIGGFKIYSCKIFHCCKVIFYLFYVSNEIQIYSFFVAQLLLLISLSQILVQINVISINSSAKKHNRKASLATDLQQN